MAVHSPSDRLQAAESAGRRAEAAQEFGEAALRRAELAVSFAAAAHERALLIRARLEGADSEVLDTSAPAR